MARIVGIALTEGKKFLGFMDSKGNIKKAKVKRIGNPQYRSYITSEHLKDGETITLDGKKWKVIFTKRRRSGGYYYNLIEHQ